MREKGAALIEYAMIAPLLFLLLFGIIEFSILIFSYNTIANAAREGARYGIIHPADSAGIESAARGLTTGLDQAALQVTSAASGKTIRVEIVYPVDLMTGLLVEAVGGDPTVELHAAATMHIE